MGGFGSFLSSLLTTGTQAADANQQGIAQANKINQGNALDTFNLLRQQREDEEKKQLQQAQIGNLQSETEARLHPPIKPREAYIVPGVGIGQLNDQGGFDVAPGGAEPAKAPPSISPYQQALLDQQKKFHADNVALAQQRLDAAAKAKAALGGKDAAQMQMAYSMAKPAIDQLTSYFTKQTNPNAIARIGSHIPLVGNSIVGAADADYQKAQQAAEVLATQYVETLPKGRASPGLIATMQKQIAPELGDTPATRAQKANTIAVFEKALKARANAGAQAQQTPDNPFSDLLPPLPSE